jgi:hypothetical protein
MKQLIFIFAIGISISFSNIEKGNCPMCLGSGSIINQATTIGHNIQDEGPWVTHSINGTKLAHCPLCKGSGNWGSGPEIVPPKKHSDYKTAGQIIEDFANGKYRSNMYYLNGNSESEVSSAIEKLNKNYKSPSDYMWSVINSKPSPIFESIMKGQKPRSNYSNGNNQNKIVYPSSIPVPCEHKVPCVHRIPCNHVINTPWGYRYSHTFDYQHPYDLLHQYDYK